MRKMQTAKSPIQFSQCLKKDRRILFHEKFHCLIDFIAFWEPRYEKEISVKVKQSRVRIYKLFAVKMAQNAKTKSNKNVTYGISNSFLFFTK